MMLGYKPLDSWERPKKRQPWITGPTYLFTAYGERCRFCERGILWVRHPEKKYAMPIEPESWDGSKWYKTGVHRHHAHRCEKLRTAWAEWQERNKEYLI